MVESITVEKLLEIAQEVRNSFDEIHGQCYSASKQLMDALASQTAAEADAIGIEEVRVGSSGTIRHYVVAYPARNIGIDAQGRVLIDITLDQYCIEFEDEGLVKTSLGPRESIPEVNFYRTKSESPYQ